MRYSNQRRYLYLYLLQVRARHTDVLGAPLQLRSYWKFGSQRADFRLDYTYNGSAMFSARPLSNVAIHVPVNGDVKKMQCKPPGMWCVLHRVTTCLEKLEMSGNLKHVREISGIVLAVKELSGKNLVMEKCPKTVH